MSEDHTEVNALFIQPTYSCANKCPGCYVQAHRRSLQPQLSASAWGRLMDVFFHNLNGCWANQITLSVDNLPVHEKPGRERMLETYKHFNELIRADDRREDRPELHMTVHDMHSLAEYYQCTIPPNVDILSVSNLLTADESGVQGIRNNLGIKVHWNLMFWGSPGERDIDYVDSVAPFVDKIYFIFRKSLVGRLRGLVQAGRDEENMVRDLEFLHRIQTKAHEDTRQKIIVDGCYQDALEFKKSGYGCCSSVSRFQVWPDGSVSGCPYAYRSATGFAGGVAGVIKNIHQARDRYDFNMCHIPQVVDSVQ
jgi:hypothetical protein